MKNKIIAIILVISSIGTLAYLAKNKKPPTKTIIKNERVVKLVKVKTKDTDIFVKSFGTVKSNEDLNFISSVTADVIFKNKNIIEGNFIKKGELLIKFDDREYSLNMQNLEASIVQAKVLKKELEVELKNTKVLYTIEKERLYLDTKNYNRYKKLRNQISTSELERFKNVVLSRRNTLQNIKTKVDSLPLKIKSQNANIKALESKRDIAKISLSDCSIYMPFNGIVYDINIEENEYITRGQKLFKAYNNEKMQIEVELSLSQLSKFKDIDNLQNVEAQFYSSSLNKYYNSKFLNISKIINVDTRTIKLLFEITQPIFKGIFLEANLKVNSLKNVFIIPKTSYSNKKVYLEKDGKLYFKKVKVLNEKEDSFIIEGLKEGDNLVISNIPDAIEGMSLKGIK